MERLTDIATNDPYDLPLHQEHLKLLLVSMNCPLFTHLDAYATAKPSDEEDLVTASQKYMDEEVDSPHFVHAELCDKLVNCLLNRQQSPSLALLITKLYLHHICWPGSTRTASILRHPCLH